MPRTIALIVLSALSLAIAHPQLNCWLLAWVGLFPLLWVIQDKGKRASFGWAFFWGFVYFFGSVGWLVYVTYPGAILLCLYLALYPAIFAVALQYFKPLPLIGRVFILAFCWTCLEYLRSTLFSGFGWATLAHTQSLNLYMIQIADITGIYGISFLVIWVNLVLFEGIKLWMKKQREDAFLRLIGVTLLILCLVGLYGAWSLKKFEFKEKIKVAVIQPNLLERINWTPANLNTIVNKYMLLTDQAAQENPELILWPETSLPGILSENISSLQRIQLKALDLNTPLVMGSVLEYKRQYFNSALLIGDDGKIKGHYNKIHLVPFGEFLPLRPVLGWINASIDIEDFTPGKEHTIFTLPSGKKFGILICFEDTLHDLPGELVKSGAQLFLNMTNDAWFKDTKQPFMHLAAAALECVSHRRSLVRSAITGVSGFINPLGQVIEMAQDQNGKKTFVSTYAVNEVPLNDQLSFYTKFSDLFTYLGFVCILGGIFYRRSRQVVKN